MLHLVTKTAYLGGIKRFSRKIISCAPLQIRNPVIESTGNIMIVGVLTADRSPKNAVASSTGDLSPAYQRSCEFRFSWHLSGYNNGRGLKWGTGINGDY